MSTAYEQDCKYLLRIPRVKLEGAGYEYLGYGRHRQVYLTASHKYVIKFPYNDDGEQANWEEAYEYANRIGRSYFPLAKCRAFRYDGITCLIMEAVQEPSWGNDDFEPSKDLPDWTRSVDLRQVGWNRRGELVAYDYSRI
jgi:hypothetical protein